MRRLLSVVELLGLHSQLKTNDKCSSSFGGFRSEYPVDHAVPLDDNRTSIDPSHLVAALPAQATAVKPIP